jgi:S-adenosylhomocysteine hydrolase
VARLTLKPQIDHYWLKNRHYIIQLDEGWVVNLLCGHTKLWFRYRLSSGTIQITCWGSLHAYEVQEGYD